jgi:Domain of unknown function (DUF4326)
VSKQRTRPQRQKGRKGKPVPEGIVYPAKIAEILNRLDARDKKTAEAASENGGSSVYSEEPLPPEEQGLDLMEDMMTAVVNINHQVPYNVYCGRGLGKSIPREGRGCWGSPFEIGARKDGTREEVIAKFERYLLEGGIEKFDGTIWDGRHLLPRIKPELRGKLLGCFCVKGMRTANDEKIECHAQILARLAEEGEEL